MIPANAQTVQWTRQFGTTSSDEAAAVAVDTTGVYVVGCSEGILPGQTVNGRFVRKYDANGNELWTQFGSTLHLSALETAAASGVLAQLRQRHWMILGIGEQYQLAG